MYYQFDKNNEHADAIRFVSLAMLKKDASRYHMEMIYSSGAAGSIVAIDGHRCHIYTPDENPLPEGYYTVQKRTKTAIHLLKNDCDMQYPDFNRITPDDKGSIPFSLTRKDKPKSRDGKAAELIRSMPVNCLDLGYLIDLLSYEDFTYYRPGDGNEAIKLTSSDGKVKGVLMPKRD